MSGTFGGHGSWRARLRVEKFLLVHAAKAPCSRRSEKVSTEPDFILCKAPSIHLPRFRDLVSYALTTPSHIPSSLLATLNLQHHPHAPSRRPSTPLRRILLTSHHSTFAQNYVALYQPCFPGDFHTICYARRLVLSLVVALLNTYAYSIISPHGFVSLGDELR